MPLPRTSHTTSSLIYHVFNRGNGRRRIFHASKDYLRFMEILQRYSEKDNLSIFHWALMPNHYHLLLEIPEPRRLSSVMAGIGKSYSIYHHRSYSSAGFLFQGRFKSKPVQKEDYLQICGLYIERNPVVAKMTKKAEDYPYSSARFYINGSDDKLTKMSYAYEALGQTQKERQLEYTKLLNSFTEKPELDYVSFDKPFGSRIFKTKLVKERGQFIIKRGQPRKSGILL